MNLSTSQSSPRSSPQHLVRPLQGQYAGFASRFVAFVVDMLLINIVLFSVSAGLTLILNFFGFSNIFTLMARNAPPESRIAGIITLLISLVVFLTLFIGYPVFFWMYAGQTPGKALMGLRVATLDGARMTFGRSLIRAIGYWLSALPLFLGFFWITIDDERQGWHDLLAGTCVIYAWDNTKAGDPLR
jgi:uncharacterized RDD family membrane protein YckC